jgi:hypothetical protein
MAAPYRNGLMTGLALGIVATLFSPTLWRWGRPAAKAAIKGGLDAYDAGRETFAEASEAMEDLVAEAQFERSMARQGPARDAEAGARAAGGTAPEASA